MGSRPPVQLGHEAGDGCSEHIECRPVLGQASVLPWSGEPTHPCPRQRRSLPSQSERSTGDRTRSRDRTAWLKAIVFGSSLTAHGGDGGGVPLGELRMVAEAGAAGDRDEVRSSAEPDPHACQTHDTSSSARVGRPAAAVHVFPSDSMGADEVLEE